MYCPNCGKDSVTTNFVSQEEMYYENRYWKKSTHTCNECLASFINYEDGSEARAKAEEVKRKELQELKRLKEKYGNF